MVNNSTNIKKKQPNNYLSPQHIEHRKKKNTIHDVLVLRKADEYGGVFNF
jgi:hypothetical protein